MYDIFRGESDEVLETSNNENTKILHGRNRFVGSIGNKSQRITRQGRIEKGIENSSFSVDSNDKVSNSIYSLNNSFRSMSS